MKKFRIPRKIKKAVKLSGLISYTAFVISKNKNHPVRRMMEYKNKRILVDLLK